MQFLRDLIKMCDPNDGSRSLFESVMAPEIVQALKDLKGQFNGVIIGGLAFSYYCKPRYTQDIDALFNSESEFPDELNGFKKNRKHGFLHNKTHVELELLDPAHLGNDISPETAKAIIDTAIDVDGIKIASKSGLVAAKLGRASYRDKDDIIQLILTGNIDLSNYNLPEHKLNLFQQLVDESKTYR